MSDLRKAAEMALEALEDVFGLEKKDVGAINALRQALAPEVTPEVTPEVNEPEGWVKIDEVRQYFDSVGCGTIYKTAGEDRVPLYLAPPKKQWVGLTKEEFEQVVDGLEDLEDCWVQIEAKLKEKHMTERQIVNWLLGFVIGILTVLAWQRVMNEPLLQSDSEATRAEELISIYKRGVKDALKTNPVSFELEQTCLEVWANKQPHAQ
jgi:hypothetical protein